MLALTQGVCCWYLFRYEIGIPFLSLALLIFSTVCITAAGYIINDYYDRAIDIRNKPQKALPDTPEAKKNVLILYAGLNVLGFLAAIPPAINAGKPSLLSIQTGTIALLWIYSKWWKRLPVIGNVTVAALTALSIVIFYGYYPQIHESEYSILFFLAGFAFLLTWMREMVKDIEDMEGDRAEGCRTLSIVWGKKPVIIFVSVLSLLVILPLIYGMLLASGDATFYIGIPLFLLVTSLSAWAGCLLKAQTPQNFHSLSNALKLIMLGGLLCLLLI